MVVHPDVPGVSVTVHVNGHPTHEFDDPVQDHDHVPTVKKYIMYTNNSQFDIRLLVQFPYSRRSMNHILRMAIYRDGKYVMSAWLHPSEKELVVPNQELSNVMMANHCSCFYFCSASRESGDAAHREKFNPLFLADHYCRDSRGTN